MTVNYSTKHYLLTHSLTHAQSHQISLATQLLTLGDSSVKQLAEMRAHVDSLQEFDLDRCIKLENELRESLERTVEVENELKEVENELRESLEKIEKRKVRLVLS